MSIQRSQEIADNYEERKWRLQLQNAIDANDFQEIAKLLFEGDLNAYSSDDITSLKDGILK